MVSSAATRSLLNQSLSPGPVPHSKGRSPIKKAKNGEVTIIPETPDTEVSLAKKREKVRRRSLAAMEKVLEEDFKRDQLELENEKQAKVEAAKGTWGEYKSGKGSNSKLLTMLREKHGMGK